MQPTIPGPKIPWCKVPNHLFDQILPSLGDTELRVLLVAQRYTAGWMRPRSSIFLSYRKLCERTGRGPDAVIRAVRVLAAKGLLEISLELSTEAQAARKERSTQPTPKSRGPNTNKEQKTRKK